MPPMCPSAAAKLFFGPFTSPPEWSDQKIFWTAKSKTIMSWAQQREQIRRAAQAGVRPRTSGLGSQILPLRGPGGQSAQLTRPNGALTRAGQFFYQLAGRQPPSRQFDDSQPLIREGASDFILLRSGLKKLVRTLAPDGNYHLTKLGKAFFKEKLGLQRQNDGLSEGQVARNVKQAVLQKLGSPSEDDAIMELSEEVYFLDGAREWTLSSQTTQHVDNRTLVETSLRQPLGALREVSYQLFKGDEILASAFERRDDKLCAARQLAELLRLPLQEVLSDFDTICDRGWQERGVTPQEIRKFCVWRGAPMLFVNCQGQLLDSCQPAVKEARAVPFTRAASSSATMRSACAPALGRSAGNLRWRSSAAGASGSGRAISGRGGWQAETKRCGATTLSLRSKPGRRSAAAGSKSRSRWPIVCRGAAVLQRPFHAGPGEAVQHRHQLPEIAHEQEPHAAIQRHASHIGPKACVHLVTSSITSQSSWQRPLRTVRRTQWSAVWACRRGSWLCHPCV